MTFRKRTPPGRRDAMAFLFSGGAEALAGEPVSEVARSEMESFLGANPRGKYGRVEYPAVQLGLDRDLVRQRLAFYQDQFGVPDEAE